MKTTGVRELKNRLSEYLREVRRGETVLVTDRGEVVARLGPPVAMDERALSEAERNIGRLVSQGRVRPPLAEEDEPFPSLPSATISEKDFERLWRGLRDEGRW